jgi:hypothetical protein
MAEGHKSDIDGPETSLDEITGLLKILMCLNKSLGQILN